MTGTPDTAAPTPRAGFSPLVSALVACSAPALVLLAIVIPFLRFHQYSLLLPESAILILGTAALGLLVGALCRLRPNTLAPALTALILSIYVFYRPEVIGRAVGIASDLGERFGNGGVVLGVMGVALFLLMCALCWLLRRHLATIVVSVFGTIVLSSVVLPTTTGGEPVESGILPAKLANLPPVVHLVLDEHIGLAGMPPEIEESATAARAIRATYKDFAIYSRAYSRFSETHNSLGSLMNHDRGEDVVELLDKHSYGYTLRQSAWFDLLKAKGYAIKVYQTPWLDMCGKVASVDACYTYPIHSPNAVQRSPLSTGARLRVLLGGLHLWKSSTLQSPLPSREAFERFQSDIAEAPRGVAYIVHLLLPHYDYFYGSDCALADPAEWQTQPGHLVGTGGPTARLAAYKLYMAQVLCTGRLVESFLRTLQRLQIYDEATIIVHGDHGSRIGTVLNGAPADMFSDRDLLDHFATFLAIKTPDTTPGIVGDPVLLQQVFSLSMLGSANQAPPPGQVLLREGGEVFTARTLRWPGLPGQTPASIDEVSALRRSIDVPGLP